MPLGPSYRGFVYLIGSLRFGWYKIGKANSPKLRVEQIGILLPFKIEVFAIWRTTDPLGLEAHLHDICSMQAINGEWFSFTDKDIERLRAIFLPHHAELLPAAEFTFSNIQEDVTPAVDHSAIFKQVAKENMGWFKQYLRENKLEPTPENKYMARQHIKRLAESRKRRGIIIPSSESAPSN